MMLLAVDVGNSTTVVGVFESDGLRNTWRLSTLSRRTPDELGMLISGVLNLAGLSLERDIDGVIIGSVVPVVTTALRGMCERYVGFQPTVVEPGVRTGLALLQENPRDLGADRIANAVAVSSLYGGPAIVVDLGTATSFDAVDRQGRFVGGAIAPGITTASEALVQRAARLPTVEAVTPPSPIGRTTVTALQSGIVYGSAGQIDGIVRRIAAELGVGVTTVATGGLAAAVLDACETIDHHDPWLTLKGLRLIWHRDQDR